RYRQKERLQGVASGGCRRKGRRSMSDTQAASQPDSNLPGELDPLIDANLDEDDRLRPEFVSAVLAAVGDGDDEAARALVKPLHPADIADLLELVPEDRRAALAHALGPIVGAEVLSELNDYVRDTVVEAL